MIIKYFINTRYEEYFTGERSIDANSFKLLHPAAQAWVQILEANQEILSGMEGTINLVYYVHEHEVVLREFDQADLMAELNAEVNRVLSATAR
ncbi:hypothetical protein [Chitinophaga sp. RAB17]|uniref:hypothetical protein n=1 Tax=Chitinophaga sp. RAB17 TaxID=3233049 RepID=UPI003F939DB4